ARRPTQGHRPRRHQGHRPGNEDRRPPRRAHRRAHRCGRWPVGRRPLARHQVTGPRRAPRRHHSSHRRRPTMTDTDTTLADSVARAVARMSWLTDTDQATVDLAMRYAYQIDAALERGGQDATKGMHLGPHLLRTLDTL